MEFFFRRVYRGSIKAVVFDWAGTTVDFGCMAPAEVFIALFKSRGIDLSNQQAREPMGMHKKDHIRILTQMEPVARQWQERFGAIPVEQDVESLFKEFVPRQVTCIADHADLIPETVETVSELRRRGIRIGSSSGYTREMMDALMPRAAAAGYAPDNAVCVSDVPAGRPAPWMALQSAMQLGVYPTEAIVKIGDTPADIGEGLNAGMWTIGVVEHGNEVGLPREKLDALSPSARQAVIERARQRLAGAGAHFLADTMGAVPSIIDTIEGLLSQGWRP